MSVAASSTFPPDQRSSIFTGPTVSATICSQTRCWLSMPGRASVFGTFKEFITIRGIAIFRHRPLCSQ